MLLVVVTLIYIHFSSKQHQLLVKGLFISKNYNRYIQLKKQQYVDSNSLTLVIGFITLSLANMFAKLVSSTVFKLLNWSSPVSLLQLYPSVN